MKDIHILPLQGNWYKTPKINVHRLGHIVNHRKIRWRHLNVMTE